MTLLELRALHARRRALLRLAVFCAVVLAVVVLAACGPGDTEIAGTPVSGEADRVAEVRAASVSKPVLVDGDSFHRITTTTVAPTTTTTTVAPTTTAAPVVTTAQAAVPSGSVWDRLRECEAPDWAGGWSANTGNGFYGGLQFTLSSWQWVGGTGYPHEHSREVQIVMGERLLAKQGWGAWPACSKKLGLR